MDTKRYIGRDVELVFSDAPTVEELEQVEGWAERIQHTSGPHKFIFVHMGPEHDHQLQELMGHLEDHPGPLTADEFRRYNYAVPQKRRRINKGKGQRKANRAGRWG